MPETRPALHLDLAAEALLDGWTREQVIAALIGRIKRDQGYLAYRKACNRRTSYDSQVQQDMRALALAACWLGEGRMASSVLGVGQGQQRHYRGQERMLKTGLESEFGQKPPPFRVQHDKPSEEGDPHRSHGPRHGTAARQMNDGDEHDHEEQEQARVAHQQGSLFECERVGHVHVSRDDQRGEEHRRHQRQE
jgi:hypothetical protein